ncbi:MAG: hypothetical protein ACE5FD_04095, partial [Anaerolineae bacterium]
ARVLVLGDIVVERYVLCDQGAKKKLIKHNLVLDNLRLLIKRLRRCDRLVYSMTYLSPKRGW